MGKGGGGEAYVPVEHPDDLKSGQKLRILDLIGEGEIEGPVGGLQGVFFNDTPVQNPDGSYNHSGLEVQWVNGSQGQRPLKNFSGVKIEVPVSLEVKAGKPLVRTVTDPNIDRLRVTVGVPALFEQQDNGDITPAQVNMSVQVQQAGTWVTKHVVALNNKTRSQYLTAVYLTDLPPTPFNFRVVRDSPDSDSSKLSNKTLWSSYTEIIDVKLTYPNTAMVGVAIDSSQFSGVPRRSYLVRGRRVRVPSNYNPHTREYAGLWDGTFKVAWTNNPAWVYYDIATCERAGIGRRLGGHVDKWALYQVGRYCDEWVEDGHGGKEPRMTCNVSISNAVQAYEVMSNLASIFRAMTLWTGMDLTVSADWPQDPVHVYTNANVIDGKFTYQGSGKKARHTAVHVDYTSPDHGWKKHTEYVSDDELIARLGLNVARITAFACTSRGQAQRAGKWLLATEKLETQVVSFMVAGEGLRHTPGDVILVRDNDHTGTRFGGRVAAVDHEAKRVTLDAPVELNGEGHTFTYLDDTATPVRIGVFSQPAPDVLVLDTVPHGLESWDVWSLSRATLVERRFRCLSIDEKGDGTYAITALEHVPEKHQIIENGLVFEPPNDTLLGGTIPPVEHLQVEDTPEEADKQVRLTWSTPRIIQGIQFEVKLTRAGAVVFRKKVDDTELPLGSLKIGSYSAEVRGINAAGQVGPATSVAFTIGPPAVPVRIDFSVDNFSVTARPVIEGPTVIGTEYEWYFGTTRQEVEQRQNLLGRAFILNHQGRKPDTVYWYGVEAVNAQGRSGLLVAQTKTLLKPDDILDLIGPEIPKLDWMDEIIQQVGDNASGIVLLKDRAALVVNKDGKVSGMTVTAGDEASAIDFLADLVSFTNPETLKRDLYWDSNRNTLVIKGEIRLMDGHTVGRLEDIQAQDGDTIYTEFQFSANKVDWHFPERAGDIYLRSRTVTNGSAAAWGNVTSLKGDKGDDATERYTWIKYADSPSGAGMSDSATGKAYMGIAYNKTTPTESTNASHYAWSKIKGETGQTGSAGAGVFRLQTSTGVFPSDTATASSLFRGHVGRDPVRDDVLTVYKVDSSGVVTQADSRMFDGSRWVSPKLFVDGDVIALGTIRGEHIVAGVELRAPLITAGQVRGGDAGFGSHGPYNGYRTFIHSDGRVETNYIDAKGGTLDNLTINGKAVFKGRLDGASGHFAGTVSAAQVIGAKVLRASGRLGLNGVASNVNTGYRAGAWGDSKRTYIVELATYGSVTTNNAGAARWGAFVRNNPYILTPWSGGATVHFDAETRFLHCWPESNFGISWKLWELL